MRPLITPLNQRQRLWKRASFATLSGFLIFLLVLPTLLTQLIRYQVPRMGLGQIEIGNIDLNLFRGKLLIEEVELYRSAARVFSLQRAEMDLGMLSLAERQIHIQSLSLQGLSVTIKQDEGQSLQIAGIPLSSTPAESPQPQTADESNSWSFGVDSVNLTGSSIQVIHPQFSETLQLDNISLGALAMWRPEYVTPLSLDLRLREGGVSIQAKTTPFAGEPEHNIELGISSLPLQSFTGFAEPVLAELRGEFSTQMQLQLKQHTGERISLNQQGTLSLSNLKLQSGETTLVQQGMDWNGSLDSEDITDISALKVTGNLKLTDTGLMMEGRKEPAISLHGLALNGLNLQGNKQLTLSEIVIDSLSAEAARTDRGMLVAGLPETSSKPDADAGAQAQEEISGDEQPVTGEVTGEAEPFSFRIERLVLGGNNRFTFDDQTVKPSFRHSITLTEAELQQLDSSQPDQATTVRIKGKDDYYTTFIVEGEIKPFATQLNLDLKAKLSGFDMPPTSPYLAQLLGYRINTGQLESEVAMRIGNNNMDGEVDLRMNQLQLEREDPARIEEFQSKTPLPLNTALSLLRDKNDNIKLKLPISGKLDDPQFDLNDIINTALGKALKSSSVSYLKLLLQPYGSLITVVQLAGKATGNIQLTPVQFTAGSPELTPESGPYIEKLSQLMEKKGINLQICGFATTTDLLAMTKGKTKEIPAAGHPALEALAKQRAENIKSILVNSYSVQPNQLFICHPELERSAEAIPRVELSL